MRPGELPRTSKEYISSKVPLLLHTQSHKLPLQQEAGSGVLVYVDLQMTTGNVSCTDLGMDLVRVPRLMQILNGSRLFHSKSSAGPGFHGGSDHKVDQPAVSVTRPEMRIAFVFVFHLLEKKASFLFSYPSIQSLSIDVL